MSLFSSFAERFDRATHPGFAGRQTTVDFFVVKENSADQSPMPLTLLRVEKKGTEFTSFNNKLVKGMKDITEKRSSVIKDCDCDGMAFSSDSTCEGVVLAELKSRFSTQALNHAFEQMFCSFLKLHAMLSICKENNMDAVLVHFVAACQCFEDNDQKDTVYVTLNKAEMCPDLSFEGSFLRKLVEQHTIIVSLGKLAESWNISLSEVLARKTLSLSLIMTDLYGDKQAVFKM